MLGGRSGGGACASVFSRERAEKVVKNMGAWDDASFCRVVEYKMSKLNER